MGIVVESLDVQEDPSFRKLDYFGLEDALQFRPFVLYEAHAKSRMGFTMNPDGSSFQYGFLFPQVSHTQLKGETPLTALPKTSEALFDALAYASVIRASQIKPFSREELERLRSGNSSQMYLPQSAPRRFVLSPFETYALHVDDLSCADQDMVDEFNAEQARLHKQSPANASLNTLLCSLLNDHSFLVKTKSEIEILYALKVQVYALDERIK